MKQYASSHGLAILGVFVLFAAAPACAQQWAIDAGNSSMGILAEVIADDDCNGMIAPGVEEYDGFAATCHPGNQCGRREGVANDS